MKKVYNTRYWYYEALPDEYKHLMQIPDLPPWNVLKITIEAWGEIPTFLYYPNFLTIEHPELKHSFTFTDASDLSSIKFRKYNPDNPPILHRKELMLPDEWYSERPGLMKKFTRLTEMEIASGLLRAPVPGYRKQWQEKLKKMGLSIDKFVVYST